MTGSVDLVDLGETPIRDRLEVDPRTVGGGRSGRRRIDPKVILLVAAAIVGVGLLGTGPRPPGPATSMSPGPLGSPTAAPTASIDPCPEAGLPSPVLTLGAPRQQSGVRVQPEAIVTILRNIGFPPSAATSLTAIPGQRLHLTLGDSRCLETWRVDLHRADAPADEILPVTDLEEMEAGHKLAFNAPPAARWVLRVVLRLRGPTFEDAPWAVYWIGLNTGPVDPGEPVGPQVTPAIACGPLDSGATFPPAVELVLGDGAAIAGTLGDHTWIGRTVTTGVPDLSSVTPIDLPLGTPVTLRIEGQACAVSWLIEGGPPDQRRESWQQGWSWDGWEQTPRDPAIAAQNVFTVQADALGEFVIRGTFGFQNGGHAIVYWRAHRIVPPAPEAWVAVASSGARVPLVVGCGISVQLGSGFDAGWGGAEWCPPDEPSVTGESTLVVTADGLLRSEAPGLRIMNWNAAVPSEGLGLAGGWSQVGLSGIEIPAPPAGSRLVQIQLSFQAEGYVITVPYWVRIDVPG